ncbi:MAG: phosphate ABC transporter substrate-binding protein PstS family protein [Solirubrobacterales bacterium]
MKRFNVPLIALTTIALSLALVAAGCGSDDDSGSSNGDLSGSIKIDGSSTVAPLSEAAAEKFQAENPNVRVTVGTSGTGGGFEKFCAGETDISDASRPIKDEEIEACEKNGISYEQLVVANDGLAVVVNPENDFAQCLTLDQLKTIWDKGSKVDNWNQVDSSFPDEKMELYGPGTDSGTFDYFTEAVNGEEGQSRSDYNATEDDNVIVQGVSGSKGATGYFGLSYVEQNEGKVKAVEVDGGDGCVAPSTETVQDGTYKPLGRELFIYTSGDALQRPEVKSFLDFYINNQAEIAEQALYVPMTEEQAAASMAAVEKLAGGEGATS